MKEAYVAVEEDLRSSLRVGERKEIGFILKPHLVHLDPGMGS